LVPDFFESVYQKALAVELQQVGLKVVCEYPISVTYAGINVGDFSAGMLVEDRILIENKWIGLQQQAAAPILSNPVNPVEEIKVQGKTRPEAASTRI